MSDKATTYEAKKRDAAEKLWLHFYNNILFEKGLITEKERNRMHNLISERSSCGRRDRADGSRGWC